MKKSYFERGVEYVIVVLFAAFCIVMISQVFTRTLLDSSILWSEEFSRYTFIWMALLASGIALKRRAHMGFDLLISKLPYKGRFTIHLINNIIVGIFLVLFFIKGIDLMRVAGMTPSPTMQIPMVFVYSILPLSAFVMIVFLVGDILVTIRDGLNEEEATENT